MSRPVRNASIIASQRISKILKPLRNSFENLTVDETPINHAEDAVVTITNEVEEKPIDHVIPSLQDETIIPIHEEDSQKEPEPQSESFTWTPPTNEVPLSNADQIGFNYYVRLMLQKANTSDMEVNTNSIHHVFQTILLSPKCLMYNVELRNLIIQKMDAMEEHILSQLNKLQQKKLDDTLWVVKSQMYRTVHHVRIRNEINQHMSKIIELYSEYAEFLKRSELLQTIHHLRNILQQLRVLPGYVQSS